MKESYELYCENGPNRALCSCDQEGRCFFDSSLYMEATERRLENWLSFDVVNSAD